MTKGKRLNRVMELKEHGIILVPIDSNPIGLDFARGHVSNFQVRRLRKQLGKIDHEFRRRATKIALLHHHCLPVFNETSSDTFLRLTNSQAVIEFFADENIDLVLHGHKHRATHSWMSIGGVTVQNRIVEVLGAGTAMKRRDFEARGHNFNLITISNSGFRSVKQFFANPPGSPFIAADGTQEFLRPTCDQLYQNQIAHQLFSVRSLHWELKVTLEGDRINEMVYNGFRSNGTPEQVEYVPPEYFVRRGSVMTPVLDRDRTGPGIELEVIERENKRVKFKVKFAAPPPRSNGVNFVIRSWDLNAASLNEDEFRRKYPGESSPFEWEEKEINFPIEDFSWHLSFPEKFGVREIRFEVYEGGCGNPDLELTRLFQSGFIFSPVSNSATLYLHKPPAGYRYRISWRIPADPENPLVESSSKTGDIPPQAMWDLSRLKDFLLDLRNEKLNSPPASERMQRAQAKLQTFQDAVAKKVALDANMEIAGLRLVTGVMVYDTPRAGGAPDVKAADGPPTGKLLIAISTSSDLNSWRFGLDYGDGNAGRAYKHSIIRVWPARKSDGNVPDWYIPGPGLKHTFLCSVPVVHPQSKRVIMAVVNIGSFDQPTGVACRSLDTEDSARWLVEAALFYVLTPLLEELKVIGT